MQSMRRVLILMMIGLCEVHGEMNQILMRARSVFSSEAKSKNKASECVLCNWLFCAVMDVDIGCFILFSLVCLPIPCVNSFWHFPFCFWWTVQQILCIYMLCCLVNQIYNIMKLAFCGHCGSCCLDVNILSSCFT